VTLPKIKKIWTWWRLNSWYMLGPPAMLFWLWVLTGGPYQHPISDFIKEAIGG